jgi:DNA-binding response OmpR family regulator
MSEMASVGKILVVDDEETMRRSLADILRLEGFQVQVAPSGAVAVDVLRHQQIDLMLLDLKMPGMDGLDVLREAAVIAPDTMVILLTAHGSLESAMEALRQQAFDYLLKPSTPAKIISAVQKAMLRRNEALSKRMLIEQLDTSLQKLKGVERGEYSSPAPNTVVSLGAGLYVDFSRRLLWLDGENQKANLTPTEGKLLNVLVEHAGKVLEHKELVRLVQGYDVNEWEAPEVLRPLVSRLRQKLARFPGGDGLIVNVRGTGYLFERRGRDRRS